MKLENFFLMINALKWIRKHPNCTIPDLRDVFGMDKEKNLYKITSYLSEQNFVERVYNDEIIPGGPHFSLKITLKGLDFLLEIRRDIIPEDSNGVDYIDKSLISSISTEFSKFSYDILKTLFNGVRKELDYESSRILNSRKPRINVLIEKCHAQLQEEFKKIIDSLIELNYNC